MITPEIEKARAVLQEDLDAGMYKDLFAAVYASTATNKADILHVEGSEASFEGDLESDGPRRPEVVADYNRMTGMADAVMQAVGFDTGTEFLYGIKKRHEATPDMTAEDLDRSLRDLSESMQIDFEPHKPFWRLSASAAYSGVAPFYYLSTNSVPIGRPKTIDTPSLGEVEVRFTYDVDVILQGGSPADERDSLILRSLPTAHFDEYKLGQGLGMMSAYLDPNASEEDKFPWLWVTLDNKDQPELYRPLSPSFESHRDWLADAVVATSGAMATRQK